MIVSIYLFFPSKKFTITPDVPSTVLGSENIEVNKNNKI